MGMSVGNSSNAGEPMVDMNTTPLIDVMLVLLIMFIITIPVQTHATKLDLPPPNNNPTNVKPDFNVVAVDFLNTITWNDQQVSIQQLRSYFDAVGRQPLESQPELRLQPDALSRYETTAQIMAQAQQAGITKMGFVGNEKYS
jgi:biopolymer transport protein ExbD